MSLLKEKKGRLKIILQTLIWGEHIIKATFNTEIFQIY